MSEVPLHSQIHTRPPAEVSYLHFHCDVWRSHVQLPLLTPNTPLPVVQTGLSICGRAPLVLAPHTSMCMGVESFTEENRSLQYPQNQPGVQTASSSAQRNDRSLPKSSRAISGDTTPCKVIPVILHGVVSPFTGLYPQTILLAPACKERGVEPPASEMCSDSEAGSPGTAVAGGVGRRSSWTGGAPQV